MEAEIWAAWRRIFGGFSRKRSAGSLGIFRRSLVANGEEIGADQKVLRELVSVGNDSCSFLENVPSWETMMLADRVAGLLLGQLAAGHLLGPCWAGWLGGRGWLASWLPGRPADPFFFPLEIQN